MTSIGNEISPNRIAEVREWFSKIKNNKGEVFDYLDEEQIKAIIDQHKNTLVTARAGAGKTTVLIAKYIYNVYKLGMSQEKVLLFTYNKAVREEVIAKIKKIKEHNGWTDGYDLTKIFHTFDSYAYRIAEIDYGKILKEKEKYVFCILEHEKEKADFAQKILDFFKVEDEDQLLVNDEQFLTTKGDVVRSEAERDIADFLFKNGVSYKYEPDYQVRKLAKKAADEEIKEKLDEREGGIKGDFYLIDYGVVIEYWAISGKENETEIADFDASTSMNYAEYLEGKKWKEWFYPWVLNLDICGEDERWTYFPIKGFVGVHRNCGEPLEEFLGKLEQQLSETYGVEFCELCPNELLEKVWNERGSKLNKSISRFIDLAQINYYRDFEGMKRALEEYDCERRTKIFYEISWYIFEKYNEMLALPEKPEWLARLVKDRSEGEIYRQDTDYNKIRAEAIGVLRGKNDGTGLELLMVDEFQDLNDLFFDIITEVKRLNPDMRFMGVGDDWQAVNRFMGADRKYFDNFEEYFEEGSCRLAITTNHRSSRSIVENGNEIMGALIGDTRNIASTSDDKKLREYPIFERNVWDGRYVDDNEAVGDVCGGLRYDNLVLRKYAKVIRDIVLTNRDALKGEPDEVGIRILHRNNEFSKKAINRNIKTFVEAIKKNLECKYNFDAEELKKIECSTIHKAKGLEAKIVILLEVNDGVMRLVHPDSKLFAFFGECAEKILDDAARLYYVAMTRAKEQIYALYEGEKGEGEGEAGFGTKPKFVDVLGDRCEKFFLNDESSKEEVFDLTVKIIGCKRSDERLNVVLRDMETMRCYNDEHCFKGNMARRGLAILRRVFGYTGRYIDDMMAAAEIMEEAISSWTGKSLRITQVRENDYLNLKILGVCE